ncbi:MAG: superoxide dismutase family protein [Steroidobacteraceae bacterium]
MKTLALAVLTVLGLCTACSKKDEPVAAPVPSPSADTATPTPPVTTTSPAEVAPGAPVAGAIAPAAGATPVAAAAPVHMTLVSAPGNSVGGVLTVTNEGDAVSILGEITGLMPGNEYGFHVHEVGVCTPPDFTSAGGHFNPTKDPHGGPESKAPHHLGDLPNAKADKNGRALIDLTVKGMNLADKDGAPSDILGKALVVHAMRDDYKTQPSGNSGARIACGVISARPDNASAPQ